MEWIKIGDYVDVHFSTTEAEFVAKVLYKPQATGDCWYLEDPSCKIIAVMMFEKMVKRDPPKRGGDDE